MANYSTNPFVNLSQAELLQYVLDGYMATKCFVEPVQVLAIDAERKEVDVLPLITYASKADKTVIDSKTIYSLPIFQLQRGPSAIIMMPVVGDIGLIAVCDGNITSIKKTKKSSVAQTARRHSRSDAIYLGGILNASPTQFIEFKDDGILIKTPDKITNDAKNIEINASDKITNNAENIEITATKNLNIRAADATLNFDGYLTINGVNVSLSVNRLDIDAQKINIRGDTTLKGNLSVSGEVSDSVGKLSELRSNYNAHTHKVSGVESGGSTVTTGVPN